MLNVIAPAALHELYADRASTATAVAGCGLGFVSGDGTRPVLWVRQHLAELEAGAPYAPGLGEYGLDPGRTILVRARDGTAALQAGLEGARTAGLGAVLIELWGAARAYDLTASRRLALAARASGATVLLLRVAATPQPSAAETRWRIQSAPSAALAARAPGAPAFHLTLLRARSRQEGLSYRLEWNRDECRFAILEPDSWAGHGTPTRHNGDAALSGAVVALPADRPAAPSVRRAG